MKLFSIDVILPDQQGIHNKLIDLLVQVQQDSGSVHTVQEISDAVMGMLKSLKDNQARHVEINTKMMAQCLDEENFRKKECADAKSAYNAASSAFAKCQSSLDAANKNLPNLKKALKDFQDSLAKKTAERKKQHALYEQRAKDWADAISFLRDFIQQVSTKLANYPSFADLGEKLLRHVARLGRMADAVEVFVALAEHAAPSTSDEGTSSAFTTHSNYSYKSQSKTVKGLKDHLSKLLNKLIVDSKQNDIDEGKAQAAFEKVQKELNAIIARLTNDINRTNTQITNMTGCVANEGKIMTTANNKNSRNAKLLGLAGKTCTDFTKEFISATKNRLSEMKVITQILAIMEKRFGELPHELVQYLQETKNGFKAYINSTVFKKYQEYVQQHIADNAHGKKLSEETTPVAVAVAKKH